MAASGGRGVVVRQAGEVVAVTITDRRTTVISAENTTNWTGAGYGTTTVSAEGTNAVGESLANTNGETYYTQPTGTVSLGTSPGTLVYVWSFNNALQDAWNASPPPNALMLGDGTDRIAFNMAGADRRVFNHLEGPTGIDVNSWQCLVLDTGQASTMNTAGDTYVVNGSFAGLDFANITQWGVAFDTNSKALGGGYNVAVDIIRYGNDGIRLTAGTTGDRGTFLEIAVADRSRSTGAAHGILRELTTGVYGCQGPLTFGNSGAATTCYFEDSGMVLAFENRNISDDKYYLAVEGNSGATNVFVLTGSTVTTAGPSVGVTANGGNVDTLTLTSCVFANLGNRPILFSSSADASGHSVVSCTFDNCGKITAGTVDFLGCTVANSAASDHAIESGGGDMTGLVISGYEGTADTAALAWTTATDTDGTLDGATFTKGTASTHAIEFEQSGTYALNDVTVSGYNSANEQNDSAILNSVTPTVVDSWDAPTYGSGYWVVNEVYYAVGQTFTTGGSAQTLTGATVWMEGYQTASFDNTTWTARLYAVTGSPSYPTGTPLATSIERAHNDLGLQIGPYTRVDFAFTDGYSMAASTEYAIVFYSDNQPDPHVTDTNMRNDNTTITHGGHGVRYNSGGSGWFADASREICFIVYTDSLVLLNVSGGGGTLSYKNVNAGALTVVSNPVTHTVNDLETGSQVAWIRQSDEAVLANKTESSGSASYSYEYGGDVAIWVQILSLGYKNKLVPVTLGNTNATLPANQEVDPFYSNPT